MIYYDIPKETLDKTTRCRDNFKCLTSEEAMLCEVIRPLKRNGLEVHRKVAVRCDYHLEYGTNDPYYICNCPTRIEIYHHYGV